ASSAELQHAASRAADRLQSQALKERELERKLADLAGGWGFRAMLGAVDGVNTVVTAATARCLRPNRGYEPTPSPGDLTP
ncbi:unnamed protein product, partial [Polarella glacialis]